MPETHPLGAVVPVAWNPDPADPDAEAAPPASTPMLERYDGLAGVVLRLLYPREALPTGGNRELKLSGTREAPSRLLRADHLAAVSCWTLSPFTITLTLFVMPLGTDSSPDPWKAALFIPLTCWSLESYFATLLDIYHGGMHPLQRLNTGSRVALWQLWRFVSVFLIQWALFEAFGYYEFNILITITILLNLGIVGLLLVTGQRFDKRVMEASNYINGVGLAAIGSTCAYLWGINEAQSSVQQLGLGWLYELLIFVLKLLMRSNRVVGRELGIIGSETFVDALVTICVFLSFPQLSWLPFCGLLGGQVTGVLLPLTYARFTKARVSLPWSERRKLATMRFGVACCMHMAVAGHMLLLVLAARLGPNAAFVSMGQWTDSEAQQTYEFVALWGLAFAILLPASRPLFRRFWGEDPWAEVRRVSLAYPWFISVELVGAVSMALGVTLKQSRVLWALMEEDGYRS